MSIAIKPIVKSIIKKYCQYLMLVASAVFISCDENSNFVIFSIDDDVALGKQVSDEIASDPSFKILSPAKYPEVYQYLYKMRDDILNSEEIAYKDKFKWELHVIDNDTIQNAFATPGGYIYIYTGLIKYLDHADDLAGVMGHEIAHADLRHTVRNLQKVYGVSMLLSVVLGEDPNMLEQIAGQIAGTLAGLSFTREYEKEADSHSVEYLSHTDYACNGAALFFIKLTADGGSNNPPEFLSTHPSPDNRIEDINNKASQIGCDTSIDDDPGFQMIKDKLSD